MGQDRNCAEAIVLLRAENKAKDAQNKCSILFYNRTPEVIAVNASEDGHLIYTTGDSRSSLDQVPYGPGAIELHI
ncbi:hypothetical protein M0804_015380 [Polistes exclamans]|nr:hypothetical protein M0804_015380 [Polistes exclamans]